ncbi:hypothetical protein OGAPHI_003377 [Ogataea philodendri]|uniref:Uncharacterized protein n=1 Tax=Ogataea philodendri TaxID=1378263 RepID=A0A9P8P8U1_9ASCO|nr:uncharacterized protein OGAPHI_003377 [Ogataea philodendri]KAH3666927.1 hypothetical protein OGAPHI_003377 [Ogataea philodendri]
MQAKWSIVWPSGVQMAQFGTAIGEFGSFNIDRNFSSISSWSTEVLDSSVIFKSSNVTSTGPGCEAGGRYVTIVESDQQCVARATFEPNLTVRPGLKLEPSRVTSIPPLIGPCAGIILWMVGTEDEAVDCPRVPAMLAFEWFCARCAKDDDFFSGVVEKMLVAEEVPKQFCGDKLSELIGEVGSFLLIVDETES